MEDLDITPEVQGTIVEDLDITVEVRGTVVEDLDITEVEAATIAEAVVGTLEARATTRATRARAAQWSHSPPAAPPSAAATQGQGSDSR